MPNRHILRKAVVVLVLLSSAAAKVFADERAACEILPSTAAVYLEIRQPQNLLNIVYDHKLVRRVEELDQVRSAMESKKYLNFKAGVAVIESQMGMPWRKIIGDVVGGGIAVALDVKTRGIVILARCTDEVTPTKLLETLANLVSLDAKNKGNPDPVKISEYRSIKAYSIDKSKFAAAAGWLVITNNDELGKQIIDSILSSPSESLAADAQFAKAHGALSGSTTMWGYVNTAAIREADLAKKLFTGHADNPLAELIFGGILSTLEHTPYVTFGLDVSDRQLRLSASAPYDRTWAGESREYYFGSQGKGVAPPQLSVDGTIACVSSYRDVSAMWQRAGDLLSEQNNEELAKADSSLTTLFAGKDFGEDILGAFRPEGQVVVVRQEFAKDQPVPAIKLPAFGLVAEMKDAAKMQPELRRIFQSLVGFLNIVGAMNGQPQLELDMEKSAAAQFVTSSYLPVAQAKDSLGLKINYNFSPSIAFAGNRFVVASTKALAHTLATAEATDRLQENGSPIVNTDGVLHFDTLLEILRDNRGQLVAQNMLTEGHTKEEAEKKIDLLLQVVGYFDRLVLSLDTTPSELHLSFEAGLKATD
jgi:hypothetical protein